MVQALMEGTLYTQRVILPGLPGGGIPIKRRIEHPRFDPHIFSIAGTPFAAGLAQAQVVGRKKPVIVYSLFKHGQEVAIREISPSLLSFHKRRGALVYTHFFVR